MTVESKNLSDCVCMTICIFMHCNSGKFSCLLGVQNQTFLTPRKASIS